MNLPEMPYKSANKKSYQTKFGGYNHTLGASDGEIYDMTNMTSDNYPVLSPRHQRYLLRSLTKPHGIFNHGNKMMWVDGTTFYYDGVAYGTVADSGKQFAAINNRIIIFPDKKYFNTDTLKSKGTYETLAALESAVPTPNINDIYLVGSTAPYKLYYWNGDEWVMNKYTFGDMEQSLTASDVVFVAKGELYEASADNNTIYSPAVNWGDYFSVGDAVKITGCTVHKENNKTPIIREIDGNYLRFYENSFILDAEWRLDVKKDGDFVIADYQSTSPYYANLKSFYFKTDDEMVAFQVNPSTESLITDTDRVKVYVRSGFDFVYKDKKLYYVIASSGQKYELASYLTYKKLKLVGAAGAYYARNITIFQKGFYYTLHDQLVTFTLSDTQYAAVENKTCDFILIQSVDGSGGQMFIQNDSVAIDFPVSVSQLGEEVGFYMKSLNYLESNVAIKRPVPDLDFILGHHNRLWGCKDDTIYASKLGDPFNFNVFDGLSTDSWSVNIGTAGKLTGCLSYLGYPTFFKEDMVYKIYGSTPKNYEGAATMSLGLANHESMAVAGETLFYLNKEGICAYTGGVPRLISAPLGVKYNDGVAGSDGMKYYISMKDTSGAYSLFVYDTLSMLWHREDNLQALSFCYTDQLNVLTSDGKIKTVSPCSKPTGSTEEGNVPWMVQFADFYADSPNKKGVSKVHLRLHLEQSANATAYIKYNGDTNWTTIKEMRGTYKQSYYLPIRPRRGDSFSIKLEGAGKCDIYSLSLEYYTGSQL